MGWAQIISGTVLAVGLFGLAGFTFWSQLRNLRRLPGLELPDAEMQYRRRQAWRRLTISGLLLFMAILFAVTLAFLENPAQQLADERAAAREAGQEQPLTPEEKHFVRIWGWNWIAILLTLFLIVVLTAIDFLSIRSYGLKERRRLNQDRRAMIQRQLHRMRQERNERN